MDSEERRKILEEYIPMVNFISKVAGENCEVVLIDYYEDYGEIIHIVMENFLERKKMIYFKNLNFKK